MKTLNSINIRITKSYIYKTSLIHVHYTDHMIKIKPEVREQTPCSATFVWFLWSSSNTFRSLVSRMIKPREELLLVEDQSHKIEADPS